MRLPRSLLFLLSLALLTGCSQSESALLEALEESKATSPVIDLRTVGYGEEWSNFAVVCPRTPVAQVLHTLDTLETMDPSTTRPSSGGYYPNLGGSDDAALMYWNKQNADFDQLRPRDVELCQSNSDPVTHLKSPQMQFHEGADGWVWDNRPASSR